MAPATPPSFRTKLITAICSREALFDDNKVMKQKFTSYCLKHIPERAHFLDCVVLISMMVKSGRLNLNDDGSDLNFEDKTWRDFRDDTHSVQGNQWTFGGDNEEGSEYASPPMCDCKLDDDGRIVNLNILGKLSCMAMAYWDGGDPELYNVADIVRLERLVELEIGGDTENQYVLGCELPPQLQHLMLFNCRSPFFDNFPADMKQHNNLKTITVRGNWNNMGFEGSPFLKWMAKGLPNLEHLTFTEIRDKCSVNCVVNALRDYDWCCGERLKSFGMTMCKLDGGHFEMLLLEVAVPTKFPNLSTLGLYINKIESIQGIINRIDERDKEGRRLAASNSTLRRLELTGNPILKNLESNSLEAKTAILRLLNTFKKIFTLGTEEPTKYPSDVQYALAINHAGRHLFEGQQDGDIDSNTTAIAADIPLPLCPLLLERAYQKSGAIGLGCGRHYDHQYGFSEGRDWGADKGYGSGRKNATGVYYLLQNALLAHKKKNPTGDHDDDVANLDYGNEDAENDNQKDSTASKKCKYA